MRIDRIELFHVQMPLISPWRTAYGEDSTIESVLCRMTSGAVDAWGESSPLAAPCYSGEWAGGLFAVTRDWLGPALIGRDVCSGPQLQRMLSVFKGNPFAKALLDGAWWGLFCRINNLSLHEALAPARKARMEIPVGADFGVADSVDELIAQVGEALGKGFPRVKLKFRPGWEINMLAPVRKAFPDAVLHIDCNSGYRISDIALFKEIDNYGLAMIEQPLRHDDLLDHARLQQQIATPICLDESVSAPEHARQAIALGSCRYMNIKPGRVGGLTNAVAIHDLCQEAGIPCWVGGMLESALGASVCAALAAMDNFTYAADIFPSSRFYHEDLCDPPMELGTSSRGTPIVRPPLFLPEPSPVRLRRQTLQHAVVKDQDRSNATSARGN